MLLRKAELKDKKEILDITNLLYLNIPDFVWNRNNFIQKQIEKGEYFIIEESGEVAGIMSLRQRMNGMHIETLAVKEKFQSNGFGTKFIEFAKKASQEREFDTLFAYSFSEYNIADFYLKRGFKLMKYVGYYKHHKYNCFGMKLNVSNRSLIKRILNIQTKNVGFASVILMGSYFSSALLGLLRDRLLAGRFGTGKLDSYYAAFTVPDFIALIIIFGAISAAIIPIFSSYYVKSKEDAWQYVSAVLNIFLTVLIVICLLLIIFAPLLVSIIAPGFSEEKRLSTILLMRIMFLSPIIFGISNVISGILQVFGRFLATALAPVMYNIGIIMGILFFVPILGITGLAWGVVFGGMLHLLIQIPSFFNLGFKYLPAGRQVRDIFNIRHPGVLKTIKLMAPRSLGMGAIQFNSIIITAIGSTLASGSVAIFNLANNMSSMLTNAIAISLSTAVFPAMSMAYSQENKKDFEKKFSGAFHQILFLIIPSSILIFLLRAQIVRVVLGTGRFGWIDTRLTAACLGMFSLGLFAQGLIFVLSKTFYAAHNTKIPATISVVVVLLNILMVLLFVWLLSFPGVFLDSVKYILKLQGIGDIRVVALPMAFVIMAISQTFLLLIFLYKKLKTFRVKDISKSLIKILIASVVMAIAAFLIRQGLVIFKIIELQTFLGVFLQLTISGLTGIVVYIFVSRLLKSQELKMIKESFFRVNSQK